MVQLNPKFLCSLVVLNVYKLDLENHQGSISALYKETENQDAQQHVNEMSQEQPVGGVSESTTC
jgi:hypothetical protein